MQFIHTTQSDWMSDFDAGSLAFNETGKTGTNQMLIESQRENPTDLHENVRLNMDGRG